MKILKFALLVLLPQLLTQTSQAAQATCLAYEPASAAISGMLHRETFPGRPNYESIAQGDEPETGFYLTLPQAICTIADPAHQMDGLAAVREVQLVLNEKQYAELRPYLGRLVRLDGKLFPASTGHHHADLLLRVENAPSSRGKTK
ncbi:DUF4431 domain-containing protein [Paraherbaspirillum soli]|uniref:DUF4431 domain-containing protein n=1 Tax=Paraherbaspirillum soli TaxID=631222 RepID=A0ABW0M6V8_9BURK